MNKRESFHERFRDPSLTTIVATLVLNGSLYTINVGNSRAFLLKKDQEVLFLTEDASKSIDSDRYPSSIYYHKKFFSRAIGRSQIDHRPEITHTPLEEIKEGAMLTLVSGFNQEGLTSWMIDQLTGMQRKPYEEIVPHLMIGGIRSGSKEDITIMMVPITSS